MKIVKGVIWDIGGVIVGDNVASAFRVNNVPYEGRPREAWKRLRIGLNGIVFKNYAQAKAELREYIE
ncbi:MAG: hypothetical protein WC595_00410 [Candidatus Nanoarchaeia archaeon]